MDMSIESLKLSKADIILLPVTFRQTNDLNRWCCRGVNCVANYINK